MKVVDNPPNLLAGFKVLVAEDEMFIANELAHGVEDVGGTVLGPAQTVEQAMAIVEEGKVEAAILDVNLLDGDITPVLQKLVEAGVPAVVNTGTKLPAEIGPDFPTIPVFSKPTDPSVLTDAVAKEARKKRGA